MTFQSGHLLSPPPTGLIAMYGDIFHGDWYAKPHARDEVVGGVTLSEVEPYADEIEKIWESGRPQVQGRHFGDGTEPHSMIYHHLILKGECESRLALCITTKTGVKADFTEKKDTKRTFGIDKTADAEHNPELSYLFPQFSVGDSYPPIIIAHGLADSNVPHEQSEHFSKYLTSKGLKNDLYLLEGCDHFWDLEDKDNVRDVKKKIWEFLDKLSQH